MLLFVIVLGTVAYLQTDKIARQTEILYSHPLQVRRAVGMIKNDILTMRLGTRDLMLAGTEGEKQYAIQEIEFAAADIPRQFDILNQQYLGDKSDVEAAYEAFIKWKFNREINTDRILSGEIQKVKESVLPEGEIGVLREEMLEKVRIIDEFSNEKADQLIVITNYLNKSLNQKLVFLVAAILILSFVVNFILLRNIRKPIDDLTLAANRFHDGDMTSRSLYQSENEFGVLSNSFNSMVESIQQNSELTKKSAGLAASLMLENDSRKFFQAMLHSLAKSTGSQMAAVYLLAEDKMYFDCLESIGLNSRAKESFRVKNPEGEFGAALLERKIVHLFNIPEDTRFSFPTASGEFMPREIITIPILLKDEVVAVISLASVHSYSDLSVKLLNENWIMLMARVNGVLSYIKIREYLAKLDEQNKELAQHAKEMAMQADELKEYNIELELQKKQLNESNQLKSAFLSNMSHELRTPLNSVIALSGVLNRKLKNQISEEEYKYLGIIEKNGKQLLSLINDILDLSRIEAGKEEINLSSFSLSGLIKNIQETLEPIANEKGIELVNHVDDNLPNLISDSTKCHHILQNIIGNAVKFSENGKVEVSAEFKDGKFNIGIKDSGIGISKDDLPYIFDEFRQADGKASRKFGGTGLGLAIAKKFALLIRGTIEVRSQLGAGTNFVIILPEKLDIHEEPEFSTGFTMPSKQVLAASLQSQKGKNLLLVEDSEPQIIQLTEIMQEEGYHIRIARNGKEAMEAIFAQIPDAMILDLMMPEVDGFEVLKEIREFEKGKKVPVLILSAKHVTKQELSFLKENHIYQLIQKGDVNRLELLAHIRTMLSLSGLNVIEPVKPMVVKKAGAGKFNILLIEDNLDNVTTVQALLGDNYELLNAMDGLSGLEMAKTQDPNLILLDISLPEMDGFTVFNEIRKQNHLDHIPIIALTARAMKGDREDLLDYGFNDYISKPIDSITFERTLSSWLNSN